MTKAFCIVARDEPRLRTFYLKWPRPHFYEVPKSIAMIAITRDSLEKDAIFFLKIGPADELSLQDVHDCIQHGKNAPAEDVPSLKRLLQIARLPLPLRRLVWFLGLNIGRHRANHFGTIGVTSIASLGSETVVLRAPGPGLISYGLVHPDHTMKLLFHWDHRIYDGILAAGALNRLEDVLNTEIVDELQTGRMRGAVSLGVVSKKRVV